MKENSSNLTEPTTQGCRDAFQQISAGNATHPVTFIKQIKRHCEQKAKDLINAFANAIGELKQSCNELLVGLNPDPIKEFPGKCYLKLIEAKTFHRGKILKAATEYYEALRRRRSFEVKHPDILDSSGRGFAFILLSAFLLVESMLNSYFIGQGSPWGILGGAIEAFFIAFLSIGLAYSAGVGVRALLDTDNWQRNFAPALVFASVTGLVIYHLLVGHYRGCLLYGNPKTAVREALANFSYYGIILPDLYCYSLVVVGLFFAGTAFWEGLRRKRERLRAEYKRLIKHEEAAETHWHHEENNYLGSVNQICRDQSTVLEDHLKKAQDIVSCLRLNIIEANCLMRQIEADMVAIHSNYITSVEVYRRAYEYVSTSSGRTGKQGAPPPLETVLMAIISETEERIDELSADLKERLDMIEAEAKDVKDKIFTVKKAVLSEAPHFFEMLQKEACVPSVVLGEKQTLDEKSSSEEEGKVEDQISPEFIERAAMSAEQSRAVDKEPLDFDIWSVLVNSPAGGNNGPRLGKVV